MKHFLFIILLFVFSYECFAQNIKVVSFKLLENDSTAEKAMVLDQNGKKCALIRIKSNLSALSFDVGSLGIVKTEPWNLKRRENWLYVPDGIKRIDIFHERYGVLRGYDLGMSLKSGKTYFLELKIKIRHLVKDKNVAWYAFGDKRFWQKKLV